MVRPGERWQVLLANGRGPVCLHLLALRCGYRVAEMTAGLGCRERYLHEVFVRDVGLPPKDWLRRERMVVARRMLAGGRPADHVSAQLGFAAISSFRREFTAVYGVSPAAFQERRKVHGKPPAEVPDS